MSTATELQEQLESAWATTINRVSFDSSPVVRGWRDGSQNVTYPAVIVQAQFPAYGPIPDKLWEVVVSLITLTYAPDDDDQSVLNEVADKVFRQAVKVSRATLEGRLNNIPVHGIYLDNGDQEADAEEQRKVTNMRCHIEADIAAPTTTTT